MNYELHPLCTLFPRMGGVEFDSLVADIREHGQREPIITHDGMILDGGNRYRACIEAGVEPQFMAFGGGNLVAYVLSVNLHRRHMTAGQQAAIVASAQDWGKAQSKGGDRKSDQSRLTDFDSVDKRAAAAGVHRDTQMKADKVAKADPELAKQVAHGEISLPKAVQRISPQKPAPKLIVIEGGKDATELEKLRQERDELTERLAEMSDDLAGYMKACEGDDAAALEIKRLNALLHTVERQRDDQMGKCSEMLKQIKMLERQLRRSGKGAA